MKLQKALSYLEAVKDHKQAIPFRRFNGGIGRTAQAKEFGVTTARWPVKSVEFVTDLLKNAQSNAEVNHWIILKINVGILSATYLLDYINCSNLQRIRMNKEWTI
jgi:ribosomal protein L22